MQSVRCVGRGFFPLDEELELLPGKLMPREHERLVRLSGWLPFERAVELLSDLLGIEVSKLVAHNYCEEAGAVYVQMQEEEVRELEQHMPKAAAGGGKMQISADGAMVPLLHGVWAEVRTLVIGEVEEGQPVGGEAEAQTVNLSYFSRKVCAQDFQRLALVEVQRRGMENAQAVAAVMDGADWEQNFVDFHCPQAVRILDFPHAAEHINQVGEALFGEHTPESRDWLKERLHGLKHVGPQALLSELEGLRRTHPTSEIIASNLTYLKKRTVQLQYPAFRAQGWPIGSGIVESANKLVVEARLKGAGMHWAEQHVNAMLAIRNILCSGRWQTDWPRIEARLRQQSHQKRRSLQRAHHPTPCTSVVARALLGDFGPSLPQPDEQQPAALKPQKNPWRNFKHGKALYQRNTPPKI